MNCFISLILLCNSIIIIIILWFCIFTNSGRKTIRFYFFGSNWCSWFSLYLVLAPTGGPSLSLGSSYCKKQLMNIDDDKINENKMLYNCHRNCIRQPGATWWHNKRAWFYSESNSSSHIWIGVYTSPYHGWHWVGSHFSTGDKYQFYKGQRDNINVVGKSTLFYFSL